MIRSYCVTCGVLMIFRTLSSVQGTCAVCQRREKYASATQCNCKALQRACNCRTEREECCDKCKAPEDICICKKFVSTQTGRASFYTQEQMDEVRTHLKIVLEQNAQWKASSDKWRDMFFNAKTQMLNAFSLKD